MRVSTLLLTSCSLILPLHAQEDPDTLEALQRRLDTQWREAAERAGGSPDLEQSKELMRQQITAIERFLAEDAEGDDRFNARLMLTERHMFIGQIEQAKRALGALDTEACPALILLTAADLARRLRLPSASEWKDEALAKEAPFEDRMTMGMVLMTVFGDIGAGEKVFEEAHEAAGSDEERARVEWYRCTAIRQREDLADGAWFEALENLAERYPDTRFGRIARDRIEAAELEPGSIPLPLNAVDTEGEPVELADYADKVLVVHFWASWAPGLEATIGTLASLRERFHERGLGLVGVCLDEQRVAFEETLAATGMDWRQVFDGRGWEGDLALRYGIESLPDTIVIGRDGRIAARGLVPTDDYGRKELERVVRTAIEKEK